MDKRISNNVFSRLVNMYACLYHFYIHIRTLLLSCGSLTIKYVDGKWFFNHWTSSSFCFINPDCLWYPLSAHLTINDRRLIIFLTRWMILSRLLTKIKSTSRRIPNDECINVIHFSVHQKLMHESSGSVLTYKTLLWSAKLAKDFYTSMEP